MSRTSVTLALTNWADAAFLGATVTSSVHISNCGIGQLRIIQSTLWAHHFGCRQLNPTLEMNKSLVIKATCERSCYSVATGQSGGLWQREDMGRPLQDACCIPWPMRCRGYFGKNYVLDIANIAFPFRPCDLWLLPLSMETSIEYLTQCGRLWTVCFQTVDVWCASKL